MGLLDWIKTKEKEIEKPQPKYEVREDGVELFEGVPVKRNRSKGATTVSVCVIVLTFLAFIHIILECVKFVIIF